MVIMKPYDDGSKLFSIRLWALLVRIIGEALQTVYLTNLYLSALSRAFSRSSPDRQREAFVAWKTLIQTLSKGRTTLHEDM